MTDLVQQLIDAGAIPSSPFAPTSRYHGVALAVFVGVAGEPAGEPGVPYVHRRFIPQRRDIAVAAEHLVAGHDRPDLLAARYFGDPELYWRIADANVVIDPHELTETVGARILIPVAPGA